MFTKPTFRLAGLLQVLFYQQEEVCIPFVPEFPVEGFLYFLSCDFFHLLCLIISPLPVSSQVADIP